MIDIIGYHAGMIFALWLFDFLMVCNLHYYMSMLRPEARPWTWLLAALVMSLCVLWWNLYISSRYNWSAILLYIFYALSFSVLARQPWRNAIFHALMLYFLTQYAVFLFGRLSRLFFNVDYVQAGDNYFYRAVFITATVLCGSIGIRLMRKNISEVADYRLKDREIWYLLLISLPILIFCHSHSLLGVSRKDYPIYFVLMQSALSYCGVVALLGYVTILKRQKTEQEKERAETLLQQHYQQVLLRKESDELIMQKCHDLKRQVELLERNYKPELLAEYKEELKKTIEEFDSLYDTGNQTLDTLLTQAAMEGRTQKIDLICMLDGALFDFIRPVDLCTIAGNSLDNALESSRRLRDAEHRIIHVRGAKKRDFVLFQVENYYEHELRWEEGQLLTGKQEAEGHGYGLRSIRYAAEKYGGRMKVSAENGRFTLTILFPLP